MSAYSASLSPVDETEEPPPFNAALLQSRSLLQAKSPGSSVSHPRHATKCSEAAIDSATEQKLWIQCTLHGVKHRGEDWIEPIFKDDETSGCSACLPDIVVVNDAVNKFSDAFASKAPAPWQRILTKAEAGTQITNYSSRAHPEAACTMPLCNATCIPDTYLYNDKRSFFYVNGLLSFTNLTQVVLQAVHGPSEILRRILHVFIWRGQVFEQTPQHRACPKLSMWQEGNPRTRSYFGYLHDSFVLSLVCSLAREFSIEVLTAILSSTF
jgi:hypothetical protein